MRSMMGPKPKIGVLSTFGADFLSDLVDVQSPLAEKIYVIAPGLRKEGGNLVFHPLRYEVGGTIFSQILNQVRSQLSMSYGVARLAGKVDFWIFVGCDVFVLPLLTARLSGVKVMSTLLGSLEKETALKNNVLNPVQLVFKRVSCALSDRIVVYSRSLIKQWGLRRYNGKVLIAQSLFVDLAVFRVTQPLADRGKVIGYIGRLSPEKGIWNLVKAVPLVLGGEPDARFIIVGDGPLMDDIRRYLQRENLGDRVNLTGRISHDEVPRYLNRMSLYVLPSDTEGMPATILEAMACGTPVLTTPVGAIGDVMVDRETGFILENNSPECIAENITRALRYPGLADMAASARKLVESQFSLGAAQQKYRAMLEASAIV